MALLRQFAGLGLKRLIDATVAPGLGEAVSIFGGDALDQVFGHLDAARRNKAKTLAGALAGELETLLPGDEGSRNAIAEEATRLVERFGLNEAAFVALDLDPDRATTALLDHCAWTDRERRELEPGLRRVLSEFYRRVATDDARAAELLPHVRRTVLSRLTRQDAKLDAILAAVNAAKGVPLVVLRDVLRRMGDTAETDPAQIEQRLRAKADEFVALDQRLRRLTNDDPDVQRLRKEAADLLERADFAAVRSRLEEAKQRSLEIAREHQERARRELASAAADAAAQGAAARLQFDYAAAASYFAEAARLVGDTEADTRRDYLERMAEALYRQGLDFGDNGALLAAVEHLRSLLDETVRERVPLEWAARQNNLANALQTLGEREVGTSRLADAVQAYRASLEEFTRERVPLKWAMIQNNLGNVLTALGEREIAPARLKDAVAAYREALKEQNRERVPLDWAATQNNLGIALFSLSVLAGDETATARLQEAVAAYRAALAEWTRERVPLQWAMIQNNLGNALQTLGERENEPVWLEEAVSAYHAALEERTRERVPLDWAATQSNLGAALWTLGEREGGTARLEEAVSAYRAALEEVTRERVPLQWAWTRQNLGLALTLLAERSGDVAAAREAVLALRDARAVMVDEGAQPHRAGELDAQIAAAEALVARLGGAG